MSRWEEGRREVEEGRRKVEEGKKLKVKMLNFEF